MVKRVKFVSRLLQAARRLMLSQAVDAAVAGHSVGYEIPSQFSREYRCLFGAPPVRDIEKHRACVGLLCTARADAPETAMRVSGR
jgi:transcriptional regulator GlxA family with amidase domain